MYGSEEEGRTTWTIRNLAGNVVTHKDGGGHGINIRLRKKAHVRGSQLASARSLKSGQKISRWRTRHGSEEEGRRAWDVPHWAGNTVTHGHIEGEGEGGHQSATCDSKP